MLFNILDGRARCRSELLRLLGRDADSCKFYEVGPPEELSQTRRRGLNPSARGQKLGRSMRSLDLRNALREILAHDVTHQRGMQLTLAGLKQIHLLDSRKFTLRRFVRIEWRASSPSIPDPQSPQPQRGSHERECHQQRTPVEPDNSYRGAGGLGNAESRVFGKHGFYEDTAVGQRYISSLSVVPNNDIRESKALQIDIPCCKTICGAHRERARVR